ncbi:hypothetical protein J2X63_003664 [Agromyces sp. 3263]|uniref:hypothetical protein n=1 Tax=Agromyces sp. 3263 TaxID=2817750 RepID=UPI002863D3FB|nr:hypothetical protein [Agromyces sp. 3263]MDR6907956.1 hypothetical protein [Agromyces sp. 3263]
MGLFDSVSRALGSLRPLSDQELEDEREAVRERYVFSADVETADALYHEMHRYDEEMTRRANEAYASEHPNPPEPRRREHGWYLPNDD